MYRAQRYVSQTRAARESLAGTKAFCENGRARRGVARAAEARSILLGSGHQKERWRQGAVHGRTSCPRVGHNIPSINNHCVGGEKRVFRNYCAVCSRRTGGKPLGPLLGDVFFFFFIRDIIRRCYYYYYYLLLPLLLLLLLLPHDTVPSSARDPPARDFNYGTTNVP